MTPSEHKVLFTALAFVTVMADGKASADCDSVERIRKFAGLIESFCQDYAGDDEAARRLDSSHEIELDRRIERHIDELRRHEITRLPDDRQMLVKLHDRLQQRKARRMQREFYASVGEDKLADLVLRYLDEELEASGKLT